MISFVRYVAVGVIGYGLDLGLFLLLIGLAGQGAVAANVAAKIAAGIFAFLAHRHLTFDAAGEGGQARQAVLYAVLWFLNVPLATGLLAFLLWLGLPAVIAKVVADVVCVGLNFWVSRKFIFVGLGNPGARASKASRRHMAVRKPQCAAARRTFGQEGTSG